MPTVLALLTLAACGGKQAEPEAAATPAAAINANIPQDAKSQSFAKALVGLNITNFKPSDAMGGAVLTYNSLSFRPDGSWHAAGAVAIGEDSMECNEQGSWSMEPAEQASTATMTWSLESTDCAGRKSGTEQRVQMSILNNGQYKVLFR